MISPSRRAESGFLTGISSSVRVCSRHNRNRPQFFVGETVPYVTSTYNNGYSGGYGGSSYSQLSVGVELDVTPFINPDGEVSMDVQAGDRRFQRHHHHRRRRRRAEHHQAHARNTLQVTVRDRDAVMLGSFIKSDSLHQQNPRSPWLVDIPLIGNLFSSRSDSKDREELIVLMRPTVMAHPEIAAKDTVRESQMLPGVSGAAAENAQYEHDLIETERKHAKSVRPRAAPIPTASSISLIPDGCRQHQQRSVALRHRCFDGTRAIVRATCPTPRPPPRSWIRLGASTAKSPRGFQGTFHVRQ